MKDHNQDKEHGHGHKHTPWGGGRHGFWWGGGHHGPHGRGRWHGRGPGRNREEWFGEGWNWGGFGGGGRERLERGLLRHVILSVLKDSPKHGYEVIKHLEEKTHGWYSPSPGTLYPTLQYLEDMGHVRSEQENDKRVYHLTEAGQTELDKQHSSVEGFWGRFRERVPSGANMHEMRFVGDALKDLLRTVGGGLRDGALAQDPDVVRNIRAALERCQNEIREIFAGSAAGKKAAGTSEASSSVSATDDYL